MALGLAQGRGKEEPKKWYQKAWSVAVKGVSAAFKAITGNVATIAITGSALAASIATGGVVPIVVGAVLLGLKIAKTAVDAKKAVQVA